MSITASEVAESGIAGEISSTIVSREVWYEVSWEWNNRSLSKLFWVRVLESVQARVQPCFYNISAVLTPCFSFLLSEYFQLASEKDVATFRNTNSWMCWNNLMKLWSINQNLEWLKIIKLLSKCDKRIKEKVIRKFQKKSLKIS